MKSIEIRKEIEIHTVREKDSNLKEILKVKYIDRFTLNIYKAT